LALRDNRDVIHRRLLLRLILVGLGVFSGCARMPVATIPQSPGLAAIATWNMHAGAGDLHRLMSDLEAQHLTGPTVETIVLLQEALEEDAAELQRLADERHWSMFFVPVGYDGKHTRGNAILSSRPLSQPRAIPLPRERQPRAAVAASIDLLSYRMFVVSAHLENRLAGLKGLFSDAARERQAEALIEALPAAEHGIVGGDLNTWMGPREPALSVLARRFLDSPGVTRAPTFRARLVLDHLFFDLPDGWRAFTRVLPQTYGSDHHPVVGVIFAN
jgi:endonuclease/exonuclease/phosphatase family metal-dependent hydrolase